MDWLLGILGGAALLFIGWSANTARGALAGWWERRKPLNVVVNPADLQCGPVGEGSIEGFQVIFQHFRITNRTPDPVNVSLYLRVALSNHPQPILAQAATADELRNMSAGERFPDAIASPVALDSKDTKSGPIHFLLSPATKLLFDTLRVVGSHRVPLCDCNELSFLALRIDVQGSLIHVGGNLASAHPTGYQKSARLITGRSVLPAYPYPNTGLFLISASRALSARMMASAFWRGISKPFAGSLIV